MGDIKIFGDKKKQNEGRISYSDTYSNTEEGAQQINPEQCVTHGTRQQAARKCKRLLE